MGSKIFLVRGDRLVEMNEEKYKSEARLQDLLTNYPDLLCGDQMLSDSPRQFALIMPEAGVPSEEEGSDTFSLDHLFVDQDGIPTLVEVKRSTDTRIRREVVGQMLDYAANGVVYWPIEEIRARFYAHSNDPDSELRGLLGDDYDEDAFWDGVGTNLKAGKVRLVFLADEIPAQLRRIVEFLGEQMRPAEVFAVEVKQFLGEGGLQTLVPQVVAQTSRPKTISGRGETWTEETFFDELESTGSDLVDPARRVLAWAKDHNLHISWGKGRQSGSFTPTYEQDDETKHRIFSIWTNGQVQMQFGDLKRRPPFDDQALRQQLLNKVDRATDVELPADGVDRYPSFFLSEVNDVDELLSAFAWALDRVRSPVSGA